MNSVVKAVEEDRYLLTVVYSPHVRPLRGMDGKTDLASPRVLERAAWSYLQKGAKTGMWHKEGHGGEATCVESYVYRGPAWDVHGDGSLIIRKGTWLAGFILSPAAWKLYKSGHIGGVSLQGSCRRKPATAKSLRRIQKAS